MTLHNSHLLVNAWGCLSGAMRRAASTVGRRSLILASLVLAATIILPSAAFAAPVGAVGPSPTLNPVGGKDPPIAFAFNIGGYIGSGSLTATDESGGLFLATSGTLTMSTSLGDAKNTYCLVPAPGNPSTSPLGAFIYNDLVTPAANPAFPDIYGLLFANNYGPCATGFSGTPDEINIWATDGSHGHYSFYVGLGAGNYPIAYNTPSGSTDSFNATAVTATYAYSGRAFSLFQCLTGGTPDCSTPGQGNPYTTSNSITATLILASALGNNLPPTDVSGLAGFQLTLNDGHNTLTMPAQQCCANGHAWVTTDASGAISTWYLDVNNGGGGTELFTLYDPNMAIRPLCISCNLPSGNEEDRGQFLFPPHVDGQTLVYAYNLLSHGSFSPGFPGGSTTAGNSS